MVTFYQEFGIFFRMICYMLNGIFIYQLFSCFALVKDSLFWKGMLYLVFAGSNAMVIWMGDHNLILTFPVYLAVCLCCTKGDHFGRLAVTFTFFCMEMSVCALIDTYISWDDPVLYRNLTTIGRTVIFPLIYILLNRKLSEREISLSERLWKIIFGLSVMPLCSLLAVVSLTDNTFYGNIAPSMLKSLGIAVLPFTFLTSFVILSTIVEFVNYEKLQKAQQLYEMRESYYYNLKQQEKSIRLLRHDMRNHLAAVLAMLTGENTEQAVNYLKELLNSTALQGCRQFCSNETANAVLQAKADSIMQLGLEYDFHVEIPESISVSDMDLCSLLGNALDNAARAGACADDHRIVVRCRCDKGLFMLKVTNAYKGELYEDLRTTKTDKEHHGMGLSRMREIASGYGGYLKTNIADGRFELIVCLPISTDVKK